MDASVLAVAAAGVVAFLVIWKEVVCRLPRRRRAAVIDALDARRDCHAINFMTLFVEFPFLSHHSLELGLFRTYAIPSISAILSKSGQFSRNTLKRYDDTDILLKEIILHHVDSDRGSLAIRRLNFLHSHYPISDQDYLYVLSIFILVPMEWCELYGYRPWTDKEKEAMYTEWHDIGVRMGMRDIPPTIAAMKEYRDNYEKKYMTYTDANREIADKTLQLLLSSVKPKCLQPAARRIVYALLDDRLREAMGYPAQPEWLKALCRGLLRLHGMAVTWMPPRPQSWSKARVRRDAGGHVASRYDLDFHRYKPWTYSHGYRIQDLGALKPGKVEDVARPGELLCPFHAAASSLSRSKGRHVLKSD